VNGCPSRRVDFRGLCVSARVLGVCRDAHACSPGGELATSLFHTTYTAVPKLPGATALAASW
jgi:hypothetical protein